MVKVIARHVGYYGGKIREIGEAFEMADEHYLGGGESPCGWVEVVGDAPESGAVGRQKPKRQRQTQAKADDEAKADAEKEAEVKDDLPIKEDD